MAHVSITDQQDLLVVDPGDIQSLATFVLVAEGASNHTVEVALVDDETQSDLHDRFMGIPGPTDVITFPLGDDLDVEGPLDGGPPLGDSLGQEGSAPDANRSLRSRGGLGEIVVSTETAIRQAPEHPEPPIEADPLRECLLYVAHGVLHLLGYDDVDEADAECMERRQNELFTEWWACRKPGE